MTVIEKMPWQSIQSRAPFWLSVLLVIMIASAAADMSWLILTPDSKHSRSQSSRQQTKTSNVSQVRLNSVASLHLFGEAGKVETVISDAPIDAPKTTLKLVLRGIFSHSDQNLAMAIIADAGGKEKLYRVGAEVPGGAKVHKIYPDKVILERNGQLEALELPRDDLPGSAIALTQPVREFTRSRSRTERTIQAPDKLKEMRQLIKTDPQELWKQVRIEPVLENGKIKGYRLFHKDAQLMRALGISKKDVITEVNGMSLDDPAALYELMGQMDTMTDIRLTVERNGNTEVLVVNM